MPQLTMCLTKSAETPAALPPHFIGCYTDYQVPVSSDTGNNKWSFNQDWSALRALSFASVSSNMTVAKCAAIAKTEASPFFGVEKGTECWWVVGNDIHTVRHSFTNK